MILDTNILVDLERGDFDQSILQDEEIALPTIVAAEFRVGIELMIGTRQAQRAEAMLRILLEQCSVLDYTLDTAEHHARLSAETRRSGRRRGSYDLIVAAHAAETGHTIVSRDAQARFGGLGGVHVLDPFGI